MMYCFVNFTLQMCDTVDSAALVARNEWKLLAVMVTVSQYLIVEGRIKTADVRGEEVARQRDYCGCCDSVAAVTARTS